MADKRWKAFERRVARAFGCERTPLSGGSSRHTRSDTLHPTLYIECKSNVAHPLLRGWNRHTAAAKAFGLMPLGMIIPGPPRGPLVVWHSDTAGAQVCYIKPQNFCLALHYAKRDGLVSEFRKATELAMGEDKTPVLCVGQKGRPGFWICCRQRDAWQVAMAL